MAGLLMDEELLPFFGNPNVQRQGAKARALAAKRDVKTLPDPRTYEATEGLLGQFPADNAIQREAQPAFAGGDESGSAKWVYGVEVRPNLYPGEDEYFRKNPNVTGMAAEDNRIIMNPYSKITDAEKQAVMMNEAARVHMRMGNVDAPKFSLTPEQAKAFAGYSADPVDRRSTVAARILSNDPSALKPTAEQTEYVQKLRKLMGIK